MNTPNDPGTASHNWSGGVRFRAAAIHHPADEAAVATLVQAAAAQGRTLRVLGSGHSFVPFWQDDDIVLDLDALQGIVEVDARLGEAEFLAGTRLHALGAPLWAAGFALANMGDIDRQALAGAISTATHGTGETLGNLASAVRALSLVDGTGAQRRLTDADALDGAAVAFGSLGVLTRIRLQVLPRYGLRERQWAQAPDACVAELPAHVAATRHFEFFYAPQQDTCLCKSLAMVEPPAVDGPVPELDFGVAGERVGASYRIFPSARETRFNEMEYSVPAEQGPACFLALRALMRRDFPKIGWPIEYRTVAPDTRWLSPHHGRASVTLSLHQAAERPYEPFFRAAEAILLAHDGRPHWGKVHYLDATVLAPRYPQWHRFAALREQFDPGRTFANPYIRRLLGS
jgi:FAD/FMN-containing dehydrogenase